MALPKQDYRGQEASVSMMELRAGPGEVIDRVSHGLTVHVEKNRRRVASIVPVQSSANTIIHPDGSITGEIPLTYRRNLGG